MPSYDSVKFRVPTTVDINATVARHLDNVFEKTKSDTGQLCYQEGQCRNMFVRLYSSNIDISGSLETFRFGNNVYKSTNAQIKESIEELSDLLHLSIHKARLTRLDIADNLCLSHNVENYLSFFGDLPPMERSNKYSSIYYQSKARDKIKELVFYNKVEQLIASNSFIAKYLEGENLLRYELRYLKRLNQQLKIGAITGETLYNPEFRRYIGNIWANSYFDIEKRNILNIDFMDSITTPAGRDAFMAFICSQLGRNDIAEYIAMLKASNVYKKPRDYTRLKNMLNKAVSSARFMNNHDLILELDKAVKSAVENDE